MTKQAIDFKALYTHKQAAKYLKMSPDRLSHLKYENGPDRIVYGKQTYYTQQALDEFAQRHVHFDSPLVRVYGHPTIQTALYRYRDDEETKSVMLSGLNRTITSSRELEDIRAKLIDTLDSLLDTNGIVLFDFELGSL